MRIFIGWDPREKDAYDVCKYSLQKNSSIQLRITALKKEVLCSQGLYKRDLKEASSTDFTFTRFFVPFLCDFQGWALYVDCDFLFTKDIAKLIPFMKDKYALICVKHNYAPKNTVKMDGQKQVAYPRKNWSSFVLWNCTHPANRVLDLEMLNHSSFQFLHRFSWLNDEQIGEIPAEWNWLVGEYKPSKNLPAALHYTNGGPWFQNCVDVDYATEWLQAFMEMKKKLKRQQIKE